MAINPILPTDATARALANGLLESARFATLGVIHPDTGFPFLSRIVFGLSPEGWSISLISGLAVHFKALQKNSACSLLIGEPPDKGDPLAFPRLTLQATVVWLPEQDRQTHRAVFLDQHPKAKLYIDLPDFRFVRFAIESAMLNGGFGKAFVLSPNDLQ